ncbi:unnamed protein product, partial [Mesorhabditis spiculigera]
MRSRDIAIRSPRSSPSLPGKNRASHPQRLRPHFLTIFVPYPGYIDPLEPYTPPPPLKPITFTRFVFPFPDPGYPKFQFPRTRRRRPFKFFPGIPKAIRDELQAFQEAKAQESEILTIVVEPEFVESDPEKKKKLHRKSRKVKKVKFDEPKVEVEDFDHYEQLLAKFFSFIGLRSSITPDQPQFSAVLIFRWARELLRSLSTTSEGPWIIWKTSSTRKTPKFDRFDDHWRPRQQEKTVAPAAEGAPATAVTVAKTWPVPTFLPCPKAPQNLATILELPKAEGEGRKKAENLRENPSEKSEDHLQKNAAKFQKEKLDFGLKFAIPEAKLPKKRGTKKGASKLLEKLGEQSQKLIAKLQPKPSFKLPFPHKQLPEKAEKRAEKLEEHLQKNPEKLRYLEDDLESKSQPPEEEEIPVLELQGTANYEALEYANFGYTYDGALMEIALEPNYYGEAEEPDRGVAQLHAPLASSPQQPPPKKRHLTDSPMVVRKVSDLEHHFPPDPCHRPLEHYPLTPPIRSPSISNPSLPSSPTVAAGRLIKKATRKSSSKLRFEEAKSQIEGGLMDIGDLNCFSSRQVQELIRLKRENISAILFDYAKGHELSLEEGERGKPIDLCYPRLFRFKGLSSCRELRPVSHCTSPFTAKWSEFVCINPWHVELLPSNSARNSPIAGGSPALYHELLGWLC